MIQLNDYVINKETILITGEYDEIGKLCTRVLERDRSFLVDKAPKDLIDDSILFSGIGDLRGAILGAQSVLGPIKMCPFMVNAVEGLCLFPVKSSKDVDNVWFMLTHVKRYEHYGKKTKVYTSYGHSIIIDCKYATFTTKKQQASELTRTVSERTGTPTTYFLESNSKYQVIKEKGERYNFYDIENQGNALPSNNPEIAKKKYSDF